MSQDKDKTIYIFSINVFFSSIGQDISVIFLVPYLRKIYLSKICIVYCFVSLNSILFFSCVGNDEQ